MSLKLPHIKFLFLIPLLVIIAVVTLVRIHYLDVPLERDEGEYAYMGQQILKGEVPYKEAWNMKLPGVYYCYALTMAVFGQTARGIRAGALFFVLGSLIFMYLIMIRLSGVWGASFAVACAGFLLSSSSVLGMFAHSELYAVFFIILSLFLFINWMERRQSNLLLLSGFLFGIACLCKQHALFFIPAGVAGIIYVKYSSRYGKMLFDAGSFLGASLLPYLLLCVYMLCTGTLSRFWFWTFEYARAYVAEIPVEYAPGLFISNILPIIKHGFYTWILAFGGILILLLRVRERKEHSVLLLMTAAALLSTVPGFYFRQHYFIFLLPFISLCAGYFFQAALAMLSTRIRRPLLHALAAIVLVLCISGPVHADSKLIGQKDPEGISRAIYGPNPFNEAVLISKWIAAHSDIGDKIAVIGSEPEVYFYSKRKAATGFLYTYALMESHENALLMQHRFASEVERNKPRFLLFVRVPTSWLVKESSNMWIFDWYQAYKNSNYTLSALSDIFEDTTRYYWGNANIPQTPTSEYWVAVYERK